MSEDNKARSIAKTYTRARKFPQLIGTTPDGQRLPLGPYTYTQFIGAGVVGVVLWQTTGLWATGSFIRNFMVFAVIMGFTVWGLGRLPLGGRNPLSMVHGVGKALSGGVQAPKVSGLVPRQPRLRAMSGNVLVLDFALPLQEPATTDDSRSHSRVRDRLPRSEKIRRRLILHSSSPRHHYDPDAIPESADRPSPPTNADRLIAMAAASRSTREEV